MCLSVLKLGPEDHQGPKGDFHRALESGIFCSGAQSRIILLPGTLIVFSSRERSPESFVVEPGAQSNCGPSDFDAQ